MFDLAKKEEEVLAYWKEHKINEKVKAKNKGVGKPVYFLDGPPYVTGDLHPGHIWVKSLKDLFVRYKRFRGYDVVDRAGFDVHGLPTENAVERKLGITSKREIEEKIGIEKFIGECRAYIEYYMSRMTNDYERFGVSLDFSDPYLPYTNGYIETAWSMFKTAAGKGYLYQGSKTTAYCPRCESVVSQGTMEVEYENEKDPSIFITFKVNQAKSKPKISLDGDTWLLVWTTTPWTLPANVAIAANPKEKYVLARIGDKNMILAKERLDAVVAEMDESAAVLFEFYGSELDGIYYINALEEKVPKQKELRKYHKVVFSEQLVSVKEGTGLVHIAPGHGLDDYVLGVSLKLPIFSPIAPNARYNDDAGAYKGIRAPAEANEAVLKDIQDLGMLMVSGKVEHSYPHCWRCHSKIIFIASPQWFLNVQKIKKKMLKANQKISWHPEEARAWEADILGNSPDWCISRQRFWDVPMPIWICQKCGNKDIIGSRKELEEKAINHEYVKSLKDLHRPYIDNVTFKCSSCGGESKRVTDVTDVWWDSSIAFRASLTEEQFKRLFPVEFVVEYVEQIRAWFQYTLKAGLFVYGKNPYKHIVVHGIMWGTDGKKMGKSLGNYKPLNDMVQYAAADAFRLWALEHNPIANRNLNETEIKDSNKTVLMIYNIANLLKEYEELSGYKPESNDRISKSGLRSEDLWLLSRLESVTNQVTEALDGYESFNAVSPIEHFIVEDFSRFYLKLAKKRATYGSKRDIKTIINVMNYVLYKAMVLISPIMPFVTENIYLDLYKTQESIFLESWPKVKKGLVSTELENDIDIVRDTVTAILNSREKAGISLRWPVMNATVETNEDGTIETLKRYSTMIEEYVNAKHLVIKKADIAKTVVRPLFAKLGPSFKDKSQAVAAALKDADGEELMLAIEKSGKYILSTDKGPVEIKPEHFTLIKTAEEGDAVLFKHGKAHVDKEISKEMREEALIREFERRIQMVRKDMGLRKPDKIKISYEALGEFKTLLSANAKKIGRDLNAVSLHEGVNGGKEFDIEGNSVKVLVERA